MSAMLNFIVRNACLLVTFASTVAESEIIVTHAVKAAASVEMWLYSDMLTEPTNAHTRIKV